VAATIDSQTTAENLWTLRQIIDLEPDDEHRTVLIERLNSVAIEVTTGLRHYTPATVPARDAWTVPIEHSSHTSEDN
jgi:hypothetical protein